MDEREKLVEIDRPCAETVPRITDAQRDVLAERRRQVEAEGWTPEHDDAHVKSELAQAAASYALAGIRFELPWPSSWDFKWYKPATRRRNLVKAGALILAEIERLDRASLNPKDNNKGEWL